MFPTTIIVGLVVDRALSERIGGFGAVSIDTLLAYVSMTDSKSKRDHLFISYAGEDSAVCEWLAKKLALEGYAVWCDRLKLLGGEPFPDRIDEAIKERSFRVLGLLSQPWLDKPNPSRERKAALDIADGRDIDDFLIPLNVGGVRPEDLDWMISPLSFISFQHWDAGLRLLLKKLNSIDAPRVLKNGSELAVSTFADVNPIRNEQESLYSNCFELLQIPDVVHRFSVANPISNRMYFEVQHDWPFRRVNPKSYLSFFKPPRRIAKEFGLRLNGGAHWRSKPRIDEIDTRDLIVELIHKSIDSHYKIRGLKYIYSDRKWFFHKDTIKGERIPYKRIDGRSANVAVYGKRTYFSPPNKIPYRYHLSPSMKVHRDSSDQFVVLMHVEVYLADDKGAALLEAKRQSRRKHLTRDWYNEEWLARMLAMTQFLSGGGENIKIGPTNQKKIIIAGNPIVDTLPVSIDEEVVALWAADKSNRFAKSEN